MIPRILLPGLCQTGMEATQNIWITKERKNEHFWQQMERDFDMEQQIGSKQGKEYVKAIYCHPAYLTYMQSTA